MKSGDSARITIRAVTDSDAPFLKRVGPRLYPGPTASPRDPDQFRDFFERLAPDTLTSTSNGIAYVAEVDGKLAGVIAGHPDVDFFTKHSRLYVDTLTVAEEAEGRGVARELMAFIENRARELGCREVVLDVFANNARACHFYGKCGYAADSIRMVKPLD